MAKDKKEPIPEFFSPGTDPVDAVSSSPTAPGAPSEPVSEAEDQKGPETLSGPIKSTGNRKKPQAKIETTKVGVKEGFKRHSFIVREDHLKKIEATAYWDRKKITQVVDEILTQFFEGKKVRSIPKQ